MILLKIELLHFTGSNSRYKAYGKQKNVATPKSKKRPIPKILKSVKPDRSTFCQETIKRLNLMKKEMVMKNRMNRYSKLYVLLCLIKIIICVFVFSGLKNEEASF